MHTFVNFWLTRLLISLFSYISSVIIYFKLASEAYLEYVLLLTIIYVSCELLCIGGNIESINKNKKSQFAIFQLFEKRLILSVIAGVVIYIIFRDKFSIGLVAITVIIPILSSITVVTYSNEKILNKSIFAETACSLVALSIRATLCNDLTDFWIVYAIEAVIKFATQFIFCYEKIKKFTKYFIRHKITLNNSQIFGAGLVFLLVANRSEIFIFNDAGSNVLAAVIAVSMPIGSIYYTAEVVANRASLKENRVLIKHLLLFSVLLMTTTLAAVLKQLPLSDSLIVLAISIVIVSETIYLTTMLVNLDSKRFFIINLTRCLFIYGAYVAFSFIDINLLIKITIVHSFSYLIVSYMKSLFINFARYKT